MTQITWRAPEELVSRVKKSAAQQGTSMNEYLTRVLEAITNPDFADSDAERLRERLRRADLLAQQTKPSRSRHASSQSLAEARKAAGRGVPLADLISEER